MQTPKQSYNKRQVFLQNREKQPLNKKQKFKIKKTNNFIKRSKNVVATKRTVQINLSNKIIRKSEKKILPKQELSSKEEESLRGQLRPSLRENFFSGKETFKLLNKIRTLLIQQEAAQLVVQKVVEITNKEKQARLAKTREINKQIVQAESLINNKIITPVNNTFTARLVQETTNKQELSEKQDVMPYKAKENEKTEAVRKLIESNKNKQQTIIGKMAKAKSTEQKQKKQINVQTIIIKQEKEPSVTEREKQSLLQRKNLVERKKQKRIDLIKEPKKVPIVENLEKNKVIEIRQIEQSLAKRFNKVIVASKTKKAKLSHEKNENEKEIEIETIELEEDYTLAASNVSGERNFDKERRAALYGDPKGSKVAEKKISSRTFIATKEIFPFEPPIKQKLIISEDNKERIKTFLESPSRTDELEEQEQLSMLLAVPTLDGMAQNAKAMNDVDIKTIVPVPVEKEKVVQKTNKITSALAPNNIIASGQVKEELAKADQNIAQTTKNQETLKSEGKKQTKEWLAYNKNDTLQQGGQKILSPEKVEKINERERGKTSTIAQSNKNERKKIKGKIILSRDGSEYPDGYLKVFLYFPGNDKEYPDEYSHKVHEISLSPQGKGVVSFAFEDFDADEKYKVAAELIPRNLSYYKNDKRDTQTFIALPEPGTKDEDKLVSGETDLKLVFPDKFYVMETKNNSLYFFSAKNRGFSKADENFLETEIRIPGTEEIVFSDTKGQFSFSRQLEERGHGYYLPGRNYYPTIFSVCSEKTFPVFPYNLVDTWLEEFKKIKLEQVAGRGLIVGKIKTNTSSNDIQIDLSTLDVDGPYYYSKEGAGLDLSKTTMMSGGFFLFLNVPPGLHIIGPRSGTEELSGKIVNVLPETISYVEINLDKRFSISGEIKDAFDPKTTAVEGAEVSVIGAPAMDASKSDEKGFFKITKARMDHGINTIEVNHPLYITTRITACFREEKQKLFLFKTEDIKALLMEKNLHYDPSLGLVVGSIMQEGPLKIEISDAPNAQVIYFNAKGELTLKQEMTANMDGNFLIINIPPGERYIVARNAKGEIKKYFTIRADGSIINAIIAN